MPGILCEHCTAACCRYIALPLDEPQTASDFDDIRWYLLHEGIQVFVEDGDWYILISTTCRHLRSDHLCGIYETRPRICREYSTENCDYHSGDYGWQQHFATPEHLDEYLAKNPPRARRRGRGTRGRRKNLHRRRIEAPRYADAAADIRGIPLPLLPSRPRE
ncbi:MAG: YkgJ family cysteine cluster protein [Phycisphaerales bacterium]|nr:YkgJ family cysteine cluster protein [Phycisphaerales bacterium]